MLDVIHDSQADSHEHGKYGQPYPKRASFATAHEDGTDGRCHDRYGAESIARDSSQGHVNGYEPAKYAPKRERQQTFVAGRPFCGAEIENDHAPQDYGNSFHG